MPLNVFFITEHYLLVQDYFKSGRMLVKMAEAIGRIVLAGRELTRLAGYVSSEISCQFPFKSVLVSLPY